MLAKLSPEPGHGDRAGRRADHGEAHRRRPATARRSAGSRSSTENAWFAARPSGTEDVYKIYAESFRGPEHLAEVQDEARDLVGEVLSGASG